MAELHLTQRALRDIDEIDRYSIEHWGDRVAGKYVRDLQAALDRLVESPDLLKERADLSLRLRFYRVREHFLVCDVIDSRIYVLAVRHTSMDLPNRLLELEPQLVFEADILHARITDQRDG